MLVAASMLIYTSPRLFFSVAWLPPILFVANRIYLRKAGTLHQISREGWTRVSTNLAENITGMRVVTAFNRQDPNLAVFNRLQDVNTDNNMTIARVNGIYQPMLEFIKFVGRVIILLLGGYLIATDNLKKGGVGSIVAAFL